MLIVPICIVLLASPASGQAEQIQAVIDGIVSPQHAAEINAVLAAQPAVWMSRTDAHTKNLLIHASPSCTLDLALLNHLIQPFGARARCFRREALRPGQFKHLDPETCGSGELQER